MNRSAIRAFASAALLWLLAALSPALASQGSCLLPTTGTISGLTLVQDINSCIDAVQTANNGASSPTNTLGAPGLGQLWLDVSASPDDVLKMWDGTNWLVLGTVNSSAHVWTPPIAGGTNSVVAATTTNLCSVPEGLLNVTGSTTITGFGSSCAPGTIKLLVFAGTPQLTYNATSLILPTALSITTNVGDRLWAVYLGGGNWNVITYQRANGTALSTSSVFIGAIFYNAPISATVSSNTNNWAPTGLATANVIRLTCSGTANITGIVAPAIDGQILVVDSDPASANVCTFTTQDAASTAANRFAMDRPIALRPGRSLTFKYDANAARWRLTQEVTSQPIAGGFKSLKIVNGGTPNNQITITADELTVEDAFGGAARLSAVSVTPDITVSGVNGLDTGAVAQGVWYSEWVIYNPTTSTIAGLFSTSATSPTMPSGYTFKARVGWNFVENAAGKRLNRIVQYGRRAQYAVTAGTATATYPIIDSSGRSFPFAVSVASVVPTTAAAIQGVVSYSCTATNTCILSVAPNNATGSGTTNPNAVMMTIRNDGTTPTITLPFSFALESTNIYWGETTAATQSLAITGWEDNL